MANNWSSTETPLGGHGSFSKIGEPWGLRNSFAETRGENSIS
jgi:hypothetical protein